MRFRNLAVAMAVAAYFALSAFAQTSAIEGNVIGMDGQPVANAQVIFTRTDIKGTLKAKTDKKGHYIYVGLPVGSIWTISVEVDGKLATQPMPNVRAGLQEATKANFDFRKDKAANEARQAAIRQAAETGQISDDLARNMSEQEIAAIKKVAEERAEALKKDRALNDSYAAAMQALDAKQYDTAIASFEKAAELDPKQVAIWANKAEAHIGLAGSKTGAEFEAQVQKAMEAYNQALTLKPEDAGLHNNYGRVLARGRKFEEAKAEMAKAAQLDPAGAGKYYYNLGAILTNNNQPDQAMEAFQKAMDLNYTDAYFQYGVALMGKAQVDPSGKITPAPGTVDAFNKYLAVAPDGQFAQSAKEMIASLGGTVETTYKNPNAPQQQKKGGTTKKK